MRELERREGAVSRMCEAVEREACEPVSRSDATLQQQRVWSMQSQTYPPHLTDRQTARTLGLGDAKAARPKEKQKEIAIVSQNKQTQSARSQRTKGRLEMYNLNQSLPY